MSKKLDLTGNRFGRLVVVEMSGKGWRCKCDCGSVITSNTRNLNSGNTQSCGCSRGSKHGMKGTRVYRAWQAMKTRCLNPKSDEYHRYGGRGISIDERWENNFIQFYVDMGEPPDGFSLDRIDNDGNYTKANCRWADKITQSRNTSSNVVVTYMGQDMTLVEAAERSKLRPVSLYKMRHRGKDVQHFLNNL